MIIGSGLSRKQYVRSAADGQVYHLELTSSKSVNATVYTWEPGKKGDLKEKSTRLTAVSKDAAKSAKVIIDVVATNSYYDNWPKAKITSHGRINSCKVKLSSIPGRFNGNKPVSIVFLDGDFARIIEVTGRFDKKTKFRFKVTEHKRTRQPASTKEDSVQWVKKI